MPPSSADDQPSAYAARALGAFLFFAALICFAVWRVEAPLPGDASASVADEDGQSLSAVDALVTPKASSIPLPSQQFARFEPASIADKIGDGYSVIDFEFEQEDDTIAARAALLHSASASIPYVIVKETLARGDISKDFVVIQQMIARGNELMLDIDPRKVDTTKLEEVLREAGLRISWKSRLSDFAQLVLEQPSIENYDRALALLREAFPESLSSEDHLKFPTAAPNDYNSALMWNLDIVGAEDAWEFSTGSNSVVIAVIDTGIQLDHPDLVPNLWVNSQEIAGNGIDDDNNGFIDDVNGWDFGDNDADPSDNDGHGTHVSGIAGARGNNSMGFTGINWNVKIMPLRVGDNNGLSSSAIAESLRYAEMMKNRGVNIVVTNNSYGSESPNFVTRSEIRDHEDLGIIFVAAAGNDGEDLDNQQQHYPAGFSDDIIISVANSTQADSLSNASNFGAESVDLAAPGKSVYSTMNTGEYDFLSGTSMSSPLVAGAVALLRSHDPSLTWEEAKARILDTTKKLSAFGGRTVSGGRLDVRAALEPGLVEHRLEITNHAGAAILLPDTSVDVYFELDALTDATLSLEMLEGPAAIQSEITDASTLGAAFFEPGVYRLRLSAEKLGIAESEERTVIIGSVPEITNGLIHRYDFEGSGSTALDTAGDSNGTLTNASRRSSPLGQAVSYSGNNSYMTFDSTFESRVTIAAFVDADNLRISPHPRIVNRPDYFFYFSTSGNIAGVPDGNRDTLKFLSERSEEVGVWNTPPFTVTSGRWMHVAGTYDSASLDNIPSMFIDGQRFPVWAQSAVAGAQQATDGLAYSGNRADLARAWDGAMDEIRIYDRELSPTEISLLAAQRLENRWSDFSLKLVGEPVLGDPLQLVFEDANGNPANGDYEWLPQVDDSLFEVVSTEVNKLNFIVRESSELAVHLKLSDDLGTEYFTYNLSLESPGVRPGVHSGSVGENGLFWIEVDESLETGRITIFDPDSGFYRIQDPVSIDESGAFTTDAQFAARIEGNIAEMVSGEVVGYNLALSGQRVGVSSGENAFAGTYEGGVLDSSGAPIRLRVLDTGDAFLTLYGFEVDLAVGLVADSGAFQLMSADGIAFTGSIEDDLASVSGSFQAGDATKSFFLRNESLLESSRFVNLSTLGFAGSGEEALIGGFVIQGGEPQSILVRAAGPALPPFGVGDALADPSLVLKSGNTVVASNDNWGGGDDLASLFETLGAFAFPEGSLDSALEVTLDPGLYTAEVSGSEASGTSLIEIYDATPDGAMTLVNVSTRGKVVGESNKLVGGFVVNGTEPKQVLIRAVGPELANYGIGNPLADPSIELLKADVLIASSDNWMDGLQFGGADEAEQGPHLSLLEAFVAVGAFGFSANSKDAAMLIWLEPGIYTAQVCGVGDSEGIALIEVYELP